MKRATRLAELEAKPSLTRAEAWEAQELRRELRTNESLKRRYATDPQYRWHKMRQRAIAYAEQKRAARRRLPTRPILTMRTLEAAE